jgi:hypothetical protein
MCCICDIRNGISLQNEAFEKNYRTDNKDRVEACRSSTLCTKCSWYCFRCWCSVVDTQLSRHTTYVCDGMELCIHSGLTFALGGVRSPSGSGHLTAGKIAPELIDTVRNRYYHAPEPVFFVYISWRPVITQITLPCILAV